MKRRAFTFLSAVFSVGLSLVSVTAVDDAVPSAFGHYQISINNLPRRTIDFSARLESDGNTLGEMAFQEVARSSASASSEVDADDTTGPFFLKATFDCLTVNGNSAVMSGNVTEASLEKYLGRRVLLVVQDNGHGVDPAKRDKLTWGLYRAPADTPFTTDYERPDDQVSVPWLATDAERPDDAGLVSQNSEEIGCHSFPLSAFSFIDARQGSGKIQVRSGTPHLQGH